MKKLLIGLSLMIALSGCLVANPIVVKVYQKGDAKMTCEELLVSFGEAQQLRNRAKREKTSGEQITRWILFFPAGISSVGNANEAIRAADDRMKRLDLIMTDKGCKKY